LIGFFIIFGLWIVSINMENTTQRDGQDFLFFSAKSAGEWEIRFLGISLEIKKDAILARIEQVGTKISENFSRCVERLLWLKNGQDGRSLIK